MDSRLNEAFRDPDLARRLVARIERLAAALAVAEGHAADRGCGESRPIQLMEVCGTHTMAIAKAGLRALLPTNVRLLSGPGCPVCVTANHDIDRIVALTRTDAHVTSFGDMMRVPGSSTSLAQRRAEGALVEVVYSPLDALRLAEGDPSRPVVFVAVGFETTAPAVAATIQRAVAGGIGNFSVLSALKQVPPALAALLDDPALSLDGLILPGHVSTVLGLGPYGFIAERHRLPAVVTGFEPVDILSGVAMLLEQVAEGRAKQQLAIGNAYGRSVRDGGNPMARQSIEAVFEPVDAEWRGLGAIPLSGLAIRPEFAAFDAGRRFELAVEPTVEPRGCRCGDVLRGVLSPPECPLFGRGCTPEDPLGPCMVSSEGSCAAYYRYGIEAA